MITARFSMCVPDGEGWAEVWGYFTEAAALRQWRASVMTNPDVVVWDWQTNTIIARGVA